VSILPQKYFIEKIASEGFQIKVMVSPGFSPATYEPLPKQLGQLKNTKAFFSIGVPFEEAWLKKISSINPEMRIVDTSDSIKLRKMDDFQEIIRDDHEEDELHNDHNHQHDPHIWLSPRLVKKQAKVILYSLIELDQENSDKYQQNYNRFILELSELQAYIQDKLNNIDSRQFLVFHPSWGYFADEFGLKQIPIEIKGKKPTARELISIIEYAREKNIKVLFVQKQFSTKEAQSIAKAIDGKLIQIDPLAENYNENMKQIADIFSDELKN